MAFTFPAFNCCISKFNSTITYKCITITNYSFLQCCYHSNYFKCRPWLKRITYKPISPHILYLIIFSFSIKGLISHVWSVWIIIWLIYHCKNFSIIRIRYKNMNTFCIMFFQSLLCYLFSYIL